MKIIQESKKRERLKMRNFILLLCIMQFIAGCSSGEKGISKIKIPYDVFSYNCQENGTTFVEGHLPLKTYIGTLDFSNKKIKKCNFTNQGLYGPYVHFGEGEHFICASECIENDCRKSKIIIVDRGNRPKVLKELQLNAANRVTSFGAPHWTKDIFMLLSMVNDYGEAQERTILKTIDPSEAEIGESLFVENFITKKVLFLDDMPILVLDTCSAKMGAQLMLYDLKTMERIKEIPLEDNCVELKYAQASREIYALIQSAADNKGKIVKIDAVTLDKEVIAEVEGEVETLLPLDGVLYVIAKDISRSKEQKRSWLHPRNCYLIDSRKKALMGKINWTEREGKFLGADKGENTVYYAVTDYDAPAVWLIANRNDTLEKVQYAIR